MNTVHKTRAQKKQTKNEAKFQPVLLNKILRHCSNTKNTVHKAIASSQQSQCVQFEAPTMTCSSQTGAVPFRGLPAAIPGRVFVGRPASGAVLCVGAVRTFRARGRGSGPASASPGRAGGAAVPPLPGNHSRRQTPVIGGSVEYTHIYTLNVHSPYQTCSTYSICYCSPLEISQTTTENNEHNLRSNLGSNLHFSLNSKA